ncbi:MAG: class I SAM-dependent methyltransferase [Bacteroidales bacterium]|nr:class I SAM-dependent methyltransferase [Bacteroidales bacterium]MDT8402211.1 class I SAM-dependent methyltransferase [Bacteroidales bacterium]
MIEGPDNRAYTKCNDCHLIFTGTRFHPSVNEEKTRYSEHKNGTEYPGYVEFLNQAIEPALPHLSGNMKGLDFGCGPTPTLSVLLKRKGYQCDDYDPIFFPEIPEKVYDYIFATECFEHFFFPGKEIQRIYELLSPQGFLIVMTEAWRTEEEFSCWYYARDKTHVSFYHSNTFKFIAGKFGFISHKSNNTRVVVLQKQTPLT